MWLLTGQHANGVGQEVDDRSQALERPWESQGG